MPALTLPETARLVPAGAWRADPARSTIAFAVRQLMVATVHGRFPQFEGAVEHRAWGPQIRGVARAASVETGNPARDERLRAPGFLDAEAHPEIRFLSSGIQPVGAGRVRVNGSLTIAGVMRPVRLAATIDRDGDPDRVTITARGSVRRSDYGIEARRLLAAGVGDRVALQLRISLVRDAARTP
jgi:polyisoprenoid-binding protein YceI